MAFFGQQILQRKAVFIFSRLSVGTGIHQTPFVRGEFVLMKNT
jgi:hypothetical protein